MQYLTYKEYKYLMSNGFSIDYSSFTIQNINRNGFINMLYDVLYLKGFIKQIFHKAEKNNTILFEHLKFVSPLSRFVCLDKFGFTDILERIKNMTDPINNYIVVNGNKKITIINIYNHVIEKSIIPSYVCN